MGQSAVMVAIRPKSAKMVAVQWAPGSGLDYITEFTDQSGKGTIGIVDKMLIVYPGDYIVSDQFGNHSVITAQNFATNFEVAT